jgi:hypothetical protein
MRVWIECQLLRNATLWAHFAKIDMEFRDRTVILLSCIKLAPPAELLPNILESLPKSGLHALGTQLEIHTDQNRLGV